MLGCRKLMTHPNTVEERAANTFKILSLDSIPKDAAQNECEIFR